MPRFTPPPPTQRLPERPNLRIACLVPSITELLFELGLGAFVVARTGFCIHPVSQVRAVPKVGGTKDVNLAKLQSLRPTHVIVNIDENELPTVQAIAEFVPQVIVTHPRSPQDVLCLIDQLCQALENPLNATDSIALYAVLARAKILKHEISIALEQLQATVRPLHRVLYLIWRQPWMTVARDTYISCLLALANWQTWPDTDGGERGAARYPVLNGNEPWLAQIDRVLLSSEPYSFTEAHVQEVQQWLGAHNRAVKVQLVDGELLSWYGSRTLAGLNYLAQLQRH